MTHVERVPLDYERAVAEHGQYVDVLRELVEEVIELPAEELYPDCVFVEDTAVVLDEIAIITRPGAESRRGEVDAVAEALALWRPIGHIQAPGTLDGGDVLVLDREIFIGLTSRTNEAGIEQFRALAAGYQVHAVPVHGALHLKTAITRATKDALLVNRQWIDVAPFGGWTLIDVDEAEPFGANVLLVGDVAIYPREYPKTAAKIPGQVRLVPAGELAKVEGGVTCSAILIR
ncbi:MAG TPA: arginine deiminase family protein [Thermoanaerobaculia bacterium]